VAAPHEHIENIEPSKTGNYDADPISNAHSGRTESWIQQNIQFSDMKCTDCIQGLSIQCSVSYLDHSKLYCYPYNYI